MELLDGKHKYSYISRSDTHSNEENKSWDFVERLIYLFSFTKEERLKAGIFIGREGREWLDNSAIILPTPELWE